MDEKRQGLREGCIVKGKDEKNKNLEKDVGEG